MTLRIAGVTVLLASLLSTSACDCRSYFDTPLEALTEWPGLCSFSPREGAPPPPPESVEILQSEEIAGGIVCRWMGRRESTS